MLDGPEWVLNPNSRHDIITEQIEEKGTPRGTLGRKSKPYLLSEESTRRRKIYEMRREFIDLLNKYFEDKDPDLVQDFKDIFLKKLFQDKNENEKEPEKNTSSSISPEELSCLLVLKDNVCDFYHSLPYSSVIKSSAIITLFRDIPSKYSAKFLQIRHSGITNARNKIEQEELSYYLTAMGFPRNRLGEREDELIRWIEENALVLSGREKRYFKWKGDRDLMYAYYFKEMKEVESKPVSPQTFKDFTKKERIGTRKHDIFDNSSRTILKELERKLKFEDLSEDEEEEIKIEIKALEEEVEFADERKQKLKEEISELEGNNDRCVLLADFSGMKTSMSTKFHIFVVVLLTNERIEIPQELKDGCAKVDEPISMMSIIGIHF